MAMSAWQCGNRKYRTSSCFTLFRSCTANIHPPFSCFPCFFLFPSWKDRFQHFQMVVMWSSLLMVQIIQVGDSPTPREKVHSGTFP
ncbi:hypothetical protein N657DRAFT_248335 [Parathielavia appendiculata]|uniref:Uncharacterized protein n=1 Tax=Parathielavia appendiculata TaxID=2587402 RepID=A0AAN6TSB0_9PEZI|nr:hypothetical protein N657DRAFT_248335 [Parathielavia appendiculata]